MKLAERRQRWRSKRASRANRKSGQRGQVADRLIELVLVKRLIRETTARRRWRRDTFDRWYSSLKALVSCSLFPFLSTVSAYFSLLFSVYTWFCIDALCIRLLAKARVWCSLTEASDHDDIAANRNNLISLAIAACYDNTSLIHDAIAAKYMYVIIRKISASEKHLSEIDKWANYYLEN